jgi:DNA polymerase III epsilon subunit-like protein
LLAGGDGGEIHSLINPGPGEVVGLSQSTHHISDGMLAHSPTWAEFFPVLRTWVSSRNRGRRPVLFIAHNGTTFDVPFVAWECARGGLELPPEWLYADSLPIARFYEKGLKSRSLENLQAHFGILSDAAPHRAPADVHVTLHILSCILQKHRLPAGALYDFVYAFGITDKKKQNKKQYRKGLTEEDFGAMQAVREEAEGRKQRQQAARQTEGLVANRAERLSTGRRDPPESKGLATTGGGGGDDGRGAMPERSTSRRSLLARGLTFGDRGAGHAAQALEGSQAMAEGPLGAPAQLQFAPAGDALGRRGEPADEHSGGEKRSGEQEAGRGKGNGTLGERELRGQGQPEAAPSSAGLSRNSESMHTAEPGQKETAGVQRTLPPLARGRDKLLPPVAWPAGLGKDLPTTSGEMSTAWGLPAAATVKEGLPGGERSLPPLGKARGLAARFDDLRPALANTTSPEPSAAVGESGPRSAGRRENVFVRGPVVLSRPTDAQPGAAGPESGPAEGSLAYNKERPSQPPEQQSEGQQAAASHSADEELAQKLIIAGESDARLTQGPDEVPSLLAESAGKRRDGGPEAAGSQRSLSNQERFRLLVRKVQGQ